MDRTEKLLRALFDFQHFAGNERLDKIIRTAEQTGNGTPLEDSELEVNAAGEANAWRFSAEDDKKS